MTSERREREREREKAKPSEFMINIARKISLNERLNDKIIKVMRGNAGDECRREGD